MHNGHVQYAGTVEEVEGALGAYIGILSAFANAFSACRFIKSYSTLTL